MSAKLTGGCSQCISCKECNIFATFPGWGRSHVTFRALLLRGGGGLGFWDKAVALFCICFVTGLGFRALGFCGKQEYGTLPLSNM